MTFNVFVETRSLVGREILVSLRAPFVELAHALRSCSALTHLRNGVVAIRGERVKFVRLSWRRRRRRGGVRGSRCVGLGRGARDAFLVATVIFAASLEESDDQLPRPIADVRHLVRAVEPVKRTYLWGSVKPFHPLFFRLSHEPPRVTLRPATNLPLCLRLPQMQL